MSDLAVQRIPRGKGWHNTGSAITSANYGGAEYEGTVRTFGDFDVPSGTAPKSRRTGGDVVCKLVRNVSGFALTPKRLVSWASGYRNKRVAGYARTTACEVAGVVDEFWPASGVPDGELFWLAVKGHHKILTSLAGNGENVISAGDWLVALTAATTAATTAGRASAIDLTGATSLLGTQILNRIGRAASAMTTAQTNTDVLVELDLY